MSQQYVSKFSERVIAVCDAQEECDKCPLAPCDPRLGETFLQHAKRINAKAEEVGE